VVMINNYIIYIQMNWWCHNSDLISCIICDSWFCTASAISEARYQMDGSGCCLNYVAMSNPVVIRWLMRSAYGIPSDNECVDDYVIPTCCTCCAVNQMYQTAMVKGNPSTDGGSRFNLKAFSHESTQVWLLFTLIAVLSYLGIYTTIFLWLISIHATNACTPCAAVLVPSEPPCRIPSVRWTTRVNPPTSIMISLFIPVLPFLCF